MPPKPDAFERPKRFYKTAEAAPHEGGFAVRLDGRVPKSPRGTPLVVPTAALAALAAEEWAAQDEFITIAAMPATRLAYTALDGIPKTRAETAASVAEYAGSDLLCYFAEAPRALVERQERLWVPLLDWARDDLGLQFIRAKGIVHAEQPDETITAVESLAAAEDDFGLAGLAFATPLFGSAILALALARGRINADEAFAVSRLDEIFQEEQWGLDAEAAAKADIMAAEAVMLERWFAALR